ncbi:MAG: sigma-70 family RNA polymerase sigma factor [Planctomycetota bacterium]
MPASPRDEITALLRRLGAGDAHAAEALFPLVYEDLRGVADRQFGRERANHTLQPTAVVHEAYMRLVDTQQSTWKDRAHFLAIAARVMRQVLVDHARKKNARKRSGEHEAITIERVPDLAGRDPLDVVALGEAMDRLATLDDRKARVVELRLFAEMTLEEIGEALGVSKRTAEGDWYFARAWLQDQL